jgi:hypothetical protein
MQFSSRFGSFACVLGMSAVAAWAVSARAADVFHVLPELDVFVEVRVDATGEKGTLSVSGAEAPVAHVPLRYGYAVIPMGLGESLLAARPDRQPLKDLVYNREYLEMDGWTPAERTRMTVTVFQKIPKGADGRPTIPCLDPEHRFNVRRIYDSSLLKHLSFVLM